jgi:hypothetical protein
MYPGVTGWAAKLLFKRGFVMIYSRNFSCDFFRCFRCFRCFFRVYSIFVISLVLFFTHLFLPHLFPASVVVGLP